MAELMRVAFVVNNYPPRVGGVETHVSSLARHLTRLGHQVIVVTLSEHTGRVRDEDGVEVIRLRERWRVGDVLGFPVLGTKRRIAREFAHHGVDVISIHTRFFPMSWIGLRVGRRLGVPVVHTEHGSGFVVSSSPIIGFGSRIVDETVGRAVLRGADSVLGVSDRVADFVGRLSGRTARVFYNAIDEPDTAPSARQKSAEDGLRLAFVGRLVPGKGADLFIDTVADLTSRGVAVEAEVLGDGPERAALAARVDSAGLTERVRLRGRVDPAMVRRSLAGAILVNPTTLAEGFQTTLLESLAEGGRVVTFDVPGADVLRSQGHQVIVVERHSAQALADAVLRVSADESVGAPLVGWYWSDRASEYVAILEQARGGAR